jgi:predicted lipase
MSAQRSFPSFAFRRLVASGRSLDATGAIGDGDFPTFAVTTRSSVVIGSVQQDRLFVGIRGTVFFYDWRINLRFRLQPIGNWWGAARVHAGFVEEAGRLLPLLQKKLDEFGCVREIRFAGHSLGAALALLVAPAIRVGERHASATVFGTPRTGNAAAYWSHWPWPVSTHVRRDRDLAPPSRRNGLAMWIIPPSCGLMAPRI